MYTIITNFLDDLLHIDNICFGRVVGSVCPARLHLSRANSSDTEVPFLDLNPCICNGAVSPGVYDKRDDFGFDVVETLFGMAVSPAYLVWGVSVVSAY